LKLAFVLSLWILIDQALADVTLVRDGKPAAVIVIADKPTAAARQGARDLQDWLRKASGATLPIRREGQLDDAHDGALVLVGASKRTAALGFRPAEFDLEEIRIETHPGALVLIGDDERPDGVTLSGTLWAVNVFAEQHLGVRFLWPGELGEVLPPHKTVEIGAIKVGYVPSLRQRGIRNLGYSNRIQRGLDSLGWDEAAFRAHHAQAEPWFRFHRIGGSFRGRYGHAFGNYWERFHEKHPDWFALQPDGTRDNSRAEDGRRARLCVSNRGLIEQVARDAIAIMRRRPTADCVSISPNDGGRATFCLCENCEASDAPEGPMIEIWGPDGRIRHVSLTDRFVRFYSAVAETVVREFPDRYLGAYAYSAYLQPPVHAELHPNVLIGFVPTPPTYLNDAVRDNTRAGWLAWSKTAQQLFLRPNVLMASMGFPEIYVHKLADDIRHFSEHKMLLTDFDCCYQHWATDGLNYYVLARILWDPKADVDAIVDDYCRAGFGPGAGAVRDYFRRIEDLTSTLARAKTFEGRNQNAEAFARLFTDEFLKECHALLDEAAEEARGDERVARRIEFVRKGLAYARIRRDWTLARAAAREGDRDASRRRRAIEAERDAWYRDLGLSWALNAASLRFYGY
jgi:hypothetical protein